MEDSNSSKKKIIESLKIKGPSLPVHMASQIGVSSLFAGAFLSELAKEKEIKISSMKVGGSPLYFLQGQESLLEKFYQYLPGKEREAFLLLQKNKILEDNKQQPAIRVALRSIKDFASPFLKDEMVWWRFHSITEQQVKEMLEKPKKVRKMKITEKPKPTKMQITTPIKKEKPKRKETRRTRIKERSSFTLKVIDFLIKQNIEILEEKDIKKKEYSAKVKISTALGKLNFLCVAKDKKRLTENDLRIILQKSQALRMPALILFQNEVNKKAQEYAEKWSSLLKLKKIE